MPKKELIVIAGFLGELLKPPLHFEFEAVFMTVLRARCVPFNRRYAEKLTKSQTCEQMSFSLLPETAMKVAQESSDSVIWRCLDAVAALRPYHAAMKIGYTGNPYERLDSYRTEEGGSYDRMHVAHSSWEKGAIEFLEACLIRMVREKYSTDNRIGGGGGCSTGDMKGPWFVYIIVKHHCMHWDRVL